MKHGKLAVYAALLCAVLCASEARAEEIVEGYGAGSVNCEPKSVNTDNGTALYTSNNCYGGYNFSGKGVTARVSVWVPGDLISELGRGYIQGLGECPQSITRDDVRAQLEHDKAKGAHESLGKLKKVADLGVVSGKKDEYVKIPWNLMTDPAITGGASVPLRDCALAVVQNPDTGELIISSYSDEVNAGGVSFSPNADRYSSNRPAVKFTKTKDGDKYKYTMHATVVTDFDIKDAAILISETGCCNRGLSNKTFNNGFFTEYGEEIKDKNLNDWEIEKNKLGSLDFLSIVPVCKSDFVSYSITGPIAKGRKNFSWELTDVRTGEPFIPEEGMSYSVNIIIYGEKDETYNAGFKEGAMGSVKKYDIAAVAETVITDIKNVKGGGVAIWTAPGRVEIKDENLECQNGVCSIFDLSGRLLKNKNIAGKEVSIPLLDAGGKTVIVNIHDLAGQKIKSQKVLLKN